MFTQRHFKAIAQVIRDSKNDCRRDNEDGYGAILDMQWRFVALLAADNPKFDQERFINACSREEN